MFSFKVALRNLDSTFRLLTSRFTDRPRDNSKDDLSKLFGTGASVRSLIHFRDPQKEQEFFASQLFDA